MHIDGTFFAIFFVALLIISLCTLYLFVWTTQKLATYFQPSYLQPTTFWEKLATVVILLGLFGVLTILVYLLMYSITILLLKNM